MGHHFSSGLQTCADNKYLEGIDSTLPLKMTIQYYDAPQGVALDHEVLCLKLWSSTVGTVPVWCSTC